MTMPSGDSGPEREDEPSLLGALGGVAALLLSTAILLAGNGLQTVLIPIRGAIENFAIVDLGLLGTGYFAGFTLGCVLGPLLIRRAGHIRAFMAMASIASVVALLHALLIDAPSWAGLRALSGFCFAVLFVVIESWLNEKAPNRHRGTIFSIYSVITLTVITLGQLMAGLGNPALFGLFALASVLVSLATLPVAFTAAPAPSVPAFMLPNVLGLYRNSPVGFAGCLAIGFANGAFWTLGPIFAQARGLDAAAVGLFMSAVVVGGAVVQWPLGAVSDRMDRRHVIVAVTVLAIAAGLAISFVPVQGLGAFLGLGALFGAGALPLYALVVAHANDHAAPEDSVKISSGLLLVFGVGAVAGPVIASLVSGRFGNQTLFLYTAAIHTLLVLFTLWRITRSARTAADERVRFTESIIAAQTVSSVEPEASGEDSEKDSEVPGETGP